VADESGEKPQALPKADAYAEKDKGPSNRISSWDRNGHGRFPSGLAGPEYLIRCYNLCIRRL